MEAAPPLPGLPTSAPTPASSPAAAVEAGQSVQAEPSSVAAPASAPAGPRNPSGGVRARPAKARKAPKAPRAKAGATRAPRSCAPKTLVPSKLNAGEEVRPASRHAGGELTRCQDWAKRLAAAEKGWAPSTALYILSVCADLFAWVDQLPHAVAAKYSPQVLIHRDIDAVVAYDYMLWYTAQPGVPMTQTKKKINALTSGSLARASRALPCSSLPAATPVRSRATLTRARCRRSTLPARPGDWRSSRCASSSRC